MATRPHAKELQAFQLGVLASKGQLTLLPWVDEVRKIVQRQYGYNLTGAEFAIAKRELIEQGWVEPVSLGKRAINKHQSLERWAYKITDSGRWARINTLPQPSRGSADPAGANPQRA